MNEAAERKHGPQHHACNVHGALGSHLAGGYLYKKMLVLPRSGNGRVSVTFGSEKSGPIVDGIAGMLDRFFSQFSQILRSIFVPKKFSVS